MLVDKKLILFVIIAAVLLAIVSQSAFLFEIPQAIQISAKKKEIIPPPATGNIDDVADALLKEVSDEDLVIKEEDGDTIIGTTDSQEISDFGQSINESEL